MHITASGQSGTRRNTRGFLREPGPTHPQQAARLTLILHKRPLLLLAAASFTTCKPLGLFASPFVPLVAVVAVTRSCLFYFLTRAFLPCPLLLLVAASFFASLAGFASIAPSLSSIPQARTRLPLYTHARARNYVLSTSVTLHQVYSTQKESVSPRFLSWGCRSPESLSPTTAHIRHHVASRS